MSATSTSNNIHPAEFPTGPQSYKFMYKTPLKGQRNFESNEAETFTNQTANRLLICLL